MEAREPCSHLCWRRMAAAGGRGAGRAAFRSSASVSGRSRMIATEGRRWRRAMWCSSSRAHASTLVASMTVRRPRRRRMALIRCSRLKASSVAPCAVGSSVISARSRSDERTSVGSKWRAAKVDLPDAATPIRRTSASGGREMEAGRPPGSAAVGGVASVAVRAHLRIGDRRLRLSGGTRKSATTHGEPGFADEMDLAEVAIRQAPGHVLALSIWGRGHRAELRFCGCRLSQRWPVFTNRPRSGSMAVAS